MTVETAVVAPPVETTPPVVVEVPVVAPSEPTVAAPATVTEEPFAPLELPEKTELAVTEVKPVEAPKTPEAATPEPPKPGEEAKPPVTAPVPTPVVYSDFKVPEGIEVRQPERLTAYQTQLAGLGVPQDVAQQLLEQHVQVMKENLENFRDQALPQIHKQAVEEARNELQNRKQEQHRAWRAEIAADTELMKNGKDEARAAVTRAVESIITTPKERAEFDQMLQETGAGSHPAFWRFLHRAEQRLVEQQKMVTAPKSPAAPGGKAAFYDHPTSPRKVT